METASSETLFRFTTFRKPELGKHDDVEMGFIYHPTKGLSDCFFAEQISEPSASFELQWQRLITAAKDYSGREEYFNSLNELENLIDKQHIDFSIWFAQNSSEIATSITEVTGEQIEGLDLLNDDYLFHLWNNLLCQIITNENTSLRKLIVDILVANNYLIKRNGGEPDPYKYANARVVIPKGFFALKDGEDLVNNPINLSLKVNPHTAITKEFLNAKNLVANNETVLKCDLLEKEINKIKKQYDSDFQQAYNSALADHNIAVATAYNNAEYTKDPETGIITYTNLNLPGFDFSYSQPELNLEILSEGLSEIGFTIASQIGILECTKFAEVYDVIATNRQMLSDDFTTTTFVGDKTTVIGSTVINTDARILTTTNSGIKDYSVEAIQIIGSPTQSTAYYKLRFYVNTGSALLNISSLSISDLEDGKTTNYFRDLTSSILGNNSSIKVFETFLPQPPSSAKASYLRMDDNVLLHFVGKILLSNNQFWKFSFPIEFFRTEFSPNKYSFEAEDFDFGQMSLDESGSGASSDGCLPTNITVMISATADNKELYTIHFNPPANSGVTHIQLEYEKKGSGNWSAASGGIKCTYQQAQITLDKGLYNFRFRVVEASGDCQNKYTNIFFYDGTGTGSSNSVDNPDFIPSQYGVKSLGIAEFRRVEQTLCCYEPSEVSAIENVMQGEYREKGSRKLHRTETTNTTETTTEKESLSDTVTTERFSMQNQTASVLSQSVNASAHVEYNGGMVSAGAAFGFNSSKQESNSHAVNYGKDVTTRALERVVQKVREERIVKITDEFEETNKHGYDNRGGSGHISGVYRFIDKVYKNQIFNYGKRLMYEFVVPEPSKFHREALKTVTSIGSSELIKPQDPRTDFSDYSKLDISNAIKWASLLNVKIDSKPNANINVSKSFEINEKGDVPLLSSKNDTIKLPNGYTTEKVSVNFKSMRGGFGGWGEGYSLQVGNLTFSNLYVNHYDYSFPEKALTGFVNEVPISVFFCDYYTAQINISLTLKVTSEKIEQWQSETFNKIITAYEDKLREYNDTIAAAKGSAEQKATNPLFYRQIENICLKKNCMDYLVGSKNLGKSFYKGSSIGINGVSIDTSLGQQMEQYANLSRFLEEAFDWNIMSYKFYPFYWGNSNDWAAMYQIESDDPLFANFMQAGMSRVVVAVRPGFEAAVMYYMSTGKVWNGTDKILIDLELHKTIAYEMANQEYTIEKTWTTKVPSNLTMIQAGSVGLARPESGLPCSCGDTTYNESTDGGLTPQPPEPVEG